MDILGSLLITIGSLGALGATLLFPCLLISVRRHSERDNEESKVNKLSVFIPVVDEIELLGRTVSSVRDAIEGFSRSGIKFQIFICFDGSPPSEELPFSLDNTVVLSDHSSRGKWGNLKKAILASGESDWCFLCDVGSVVPTDFFTEISPLLDQSRYVGIAPSYRDASSRNFLWLLESWLKKLENCSGGPVSVHGAGVLYRTEPLKKILVELSGSWLNDDVVLPLLMRSRYPAREVIYLPHVKLLDLGCSKELDSGDQVTRRMRIVHGNIEWITKLLPQVYSATPLVGLLSLRRVFRLLWSYWATCLLLGALIIFPSWHFPLLLVWLAIVLSPTIRPSFLASFTSPFLLASRSQGRGWEAWS